MKAKLLNRSLVLCILLCFVLAIGAGGCKKKPVQYTLTVAIAGQGQVTPDVGTHKNDAGTVVTLTATPAENYAFDGWSGPDSGTIGTATDPYLINNCYGLNWMRNALDANFKIMADIDASFSHQQSCRWRLSWLPAHRMPGGTGLTGLANCYSTGKVTTKAGSSHVGGFMGYRFSSAPANSCFYDKDTAGFPDDIADVGKGIPKSTADMKQESTYLGWNFESIWDIGTENDGYPYLLNMPQL